MKEKQTEPEKIIVIDIKLTRGLVVALSCVLMVVGLLTYLALTGERAAASETETAQVASTGMCQFYLTKTGFQGDGALTACAAGYHMASLWEMADPSNLKYNTSLGFVQYDSGQGPPTFHPDGWAWVRTGYVAYSGTTSGKVNCDAWSTNDDGLSGTTVSLPYDWPGTTGQVGVWRTGWFTCNHWQPVWCIEDWGHVRD